MPGPLGSTRPGPDAQLTGSATTGREFQQIDREVRRSKDSDRPQRTGTFGVNTASPLAKSVDQKTRKLSNIRTASKFKARRKRK